VEASTHNTLKHKSTKAVHCCHHHIQYRHLRFLIKMRHINSLLLLLLQLLLFLPSSNWLQTISRLISSSESADKNTTNVRTDYHLHHCTQLKNSSAVQLQRLFHLQQYFIITWKLFIIWVVPKVTDKTIIHMLWHYKNHVLPNIHRIKTAL